MRRVLLAVLASAWALPAAAADLTVSVRTPSGQPVADAVVMVHPAAGAPKGPIRFDWPLRVAQRNVQFEPFVLVAPVGASVSFPNLDKVRHHVYSFSRGNRFELKLFGRDESRSATMATAGVVAIGCNIHDQMLAFIRVVDTPYAAKTGANGDAVLRGLPAGAATLKVWHPWLVGRGNEISKPMSTAAKGGREILTVEIRRTAGVTPKSR